MLVLHKKTLTFNILSETCDALKKTLIGVERVGLEVAPKVGIGETTNKNKEIFPSKYLQKNFNSNNTNTINNDDKKQHKIMYAQVRHYVILTLPISIMKENKEMPV